MLWITFTLCITGYALIAEFKAYSEKDFDEKIEAHIHQLIALLDIDQDKIVLLGVMNDPRFSQPGSRLYWQVNFDNNSAPLFRSASLSGYTLSMPGKLPVIGRLYKYPVAGPEGQHLVITECKVNVGEHSVPLRVAVASNHEEVNARIERGSDLIIIVLSIMGAGLFLAFAFHIWSGLFPLRILGEKLANLRARKLQRIDGKFPSEIQPLVDELNILIAHNSEVLSHARMQSANLAHGLKTPLAVLAAMTEKKESQYSQQELKLIQRQIAMIQRQIDYTLARARVTSAVDIFGALCNVSSKIMDMILAFRILYKEKNILITPVFESNLHAQIEAQDLDEVMGNIVDNACKWARSQVRIGIMQQVGKLLITVEDDGKGLPVMQREDVFRRGQRLDDTTPGFGFGLAIAKELVESYKGKILLEESDMGGLKVVLELPS